MINLFQDIKITLKSGETIIVPGDDLALNQELPKFLSMRERYRKSIERISQRKGVLRVDNGDKILKIDLTQVNTALLI